MRFLKLIFIFLLSTVYFVLSTYPTFAQNEFSVDSKVTYDVQDTGKVAVTHDITLENNFSTLYASNYSLNLESIDVQNVTAFEVIKDKQIVIPVDVQKDGEKLKISVSFPDAVVGKGAKRHFFISYENSEFAVKTGEIWEISIPKLVVADSFRSYSINLNVPEAFGLEAYISPKPQRTTIDSGIYKYSFSQKDITQTGITAGFGQFQVFSFNLLYHLENPLPKTAPTQIALPPDTAFQKLYIQKINPKPANVVVDSDGNWLAIYNLAPRQRVDVGVSGSVQIFAGFRPFPKPTNQELSDNLKETLYWQVNDARIKALASQFKTPRDIYNYVSTNLKYDFGRVQPNVQRMGAVGALENPNHAICMEFTDLFIAIARASGIPAREVDGYAYTENPQLQPLSLVADVLHAWPEYYDKEKGVWIPVDPTWAATSGGVNYFDKLDLRHFAFVMHGVSSTQPYPPGSYKLGPNPQKDVFVSFGKLPDSRFSSPLISLYAVRILPLFDSVYKALVSNPGPQALYSIYPSVYFDSKFQSKDFIEVLPPFGSKEMRLKVPFKILGSGTPEIVEVRVNESSAKIGTNKKQVIIYSLLVICVILVFVMFAILVKLKKIRFPANFAKILGISKSYDRYFKKSKENKSS